MYQIGQFRRTQTTQYYTDLNITIEPEQTINELSGTTFLDIYGTLQGENLNNQNSYYLSFGVKQNQDYEQVFSLYLYNSGLTEDNKQLIETFVVPRGRSESIIYFETILSPNEDYNKIVWELQRTGIDFRNYTYSDYMGRIMDISNVKLAKLIDIISFLRSNGYSNLEYLKKIGIQGPPSMLMCINREQIRIGKSGIYEINNGMNITSISFFPKESSNGEKDYFIMDFEY